jgi:PAS domain S-box-containing protein
LIVDDDRKTLLGMEAMLSAPGRSIVTAASGQEALRWLLRTDFSLILLDVRMPDMDGFETAEFIRQNERMRHIPIIFLSAIDTLEADVYRGAAKGAADYLFKPVVPEVLKTKVSVFVDLFHIHERLKRKAVQQSEERFRLMVESMEDCAIFMLDPEGRVTSWNKGAERIKGFRHEEIIGEPLTRFYTAEDQAQGLPVQALRRAAQEGWCEQEGWRVRKDGSRFWTNALISGLLDERMTLVGYSVLIRDLTEKKRIEEALRDSENKLRLQAEELEQQLIASGRLVSLGEITASMAHEFNNPLGIIMGFAQQLVSETDPSSSHYQALRIIDEETKRCQKLIQEILEFSRPKSAEFGPADIEKTLLKTLNLVSNYLFKQHIDLTTAIEANLPSLYADSQQLEQVMLNLFLNAIDAMPNGGQLKVEARQDDNGSSAIVVAVADTGFGIDAQDLPKIFLPFFSVKKRKGLGLGLPICERIVKNHGGKIAVESRAGTGTTFKIHLPLNLQSRPSEASLSAGQ